MVSHTIKKPFTRTECGTGFSQKGGLKMLTHTKEKLCLCKECETGLSLKSFLKKHMISENGEKKQLFGRNVVQYLH